jgi:cephalosporin hydroxylase
MNDEARRIEPDKIEGRVDGYDRGAIRGWAWYPAQAQKDVVIEVLIDGRLAAEGLANRRRADLAFAGKRNGDCAFSVPLAFEGIYMPKTVQAIVRAKDGPTLYGGEFPIDIAGSLSGLPAAFGGPACVSGFIDQFGPDKIVGWITRPDRPSPSIKIELWEAGERIDTIVADIWRTDIEETHQGDGRWGFEALVPPRLRDDRIHVIEFCLDDDRRPITPYPLRLRFPPPHAEPIVLPKHDVEDDDRSLSIRPPRANAPEDIMFSIIVNFYNMPREATRTLTSLTRGYQQSIGNLRYEVLCLDNGSSPPIDRDWVESFGPEFRLIRPAAPSPSPCGPINEAARQAVGRYVAIMIDGAHILTPGVLREVWDAVDDTPEAVVGLRQWFVGGDQRWLSSSGYTRAQEDILFDKIAWPKDGYRLFKIGSPIWESPNHWLDGMIESNCLFIPRAIYQDIGGMDERFDEPGAGYANLDLFMRAVAASPEPVIALLGQASFHQFHEGTTTNVSDSKKETRVRAYENTYRRLRGEPFVGIRPVDIRQRGQLRAQSAVVGRQRPLSPARLGITERVRRGSLPLHFDAMSADNLQSVYVECGLHKLTKWRGYELGLAPADVIEIQDIIHQVRPERIIAINVNHGVINLLDGLIQMLGLTAGRIVRVGATDRPDETLPASVDMIDGEPYAPDTVAAVERALGVEENVLVLFAPRDRDYTPIEPLRAYAGFVSCRSYLIFLGTVFGQPWLGYSKYWFQAAIKTLVREVPFVIDHSRNQQLVTTCPNGYLLRIPSNLPDGNDNAIDDFADL